MTSFVRCRFCNLLIFNEVVTAGSKIMNRSKKSIDTFSSRHFFKINILRKAGKAIQLKIWWTNVLTIFNIVSHKTGSNYLVFEYFLIELLLQLYKYNLIIY